MKFINLRIVEVDLRSRYQLMHELRPGPSVWNWMIDSRSYIILLF